MGGLRNEGRKRYKDERRSERNGKKGQADETKKKIQKARERKKRGDKQKRTRQEIMEAAKDYCNYSTVLELYNNLWRLGSD